MVRIWKTNITREVAIEKVATHFSLTLIGKVLKISVKQGRVVSTLNIIKH